MSTDAPRTAALISGPRRRAGFRAALEHRGLDGFRRRGAFVARRELGQKERIAAAALVEPGGLLVPDDLSCRLERQRRQHETHRVGRYLTFTGAAGEQHEQRTCPGW